MATFGSFVDQKTRENKDHLKILLDILNKAGFKATSHLKESKEPYIYVFNPKTENVSNDLSFGGIRIYTIAKDLICYRVQNKETTEPYGTAYLIDVKGMFKSLIKEDKDKVGFKIIYYIINEIEQFFVQSGKAEKSDMSDDMGMNGIVAPSPGDYANGITNKIGK